MVKCNCCKNLCDEDAVNDTYRTCFDCWEIYKRMSKILDAATVKTSQVEFETADEFLRRNQLGFDFGDLYLLDDE